MERQALTWSRDLRHPHTLAFSLHYAAILHLLVRATSRAEELIDELRSLAAEHRFPVWQAGADIMRGHVLAGHAEASEGLLLARKGVAGRTATGSSYHQTYFLGLLAESCRRAGETDEALSQLAEALEITASTGERWFEAELHRLRGEWLTPDPGDGSASEACLRQAVAVAQGQNAKWWELRAATSLARLWDMEGRRAEARALLAPVHGWFTEGFDTPDLKDAKALLDELT